MITKNDILTLLEYRSKEDFLEKTAEKKPNPVQVITDYSTNGLIGYIKSLSDTSIILAPLKRIDEVEEVTEELVLDVLVPIGSISLIFKLPEIKNKPKELDESKSKKSRSKSEESKSR